MITEIEDLLKKKTIDFFGIGDLKGYSDKLIDYGYPISRNYSKSISIGIILLNQIVDKLNIDSEFPTIDLYRHFCYDIINQKIDNILFEITKIITGYGFDAMPIPASTATNKNKLYGSFSHKAAAYISGLGWIGKSCLLITKEIGPRVRWGTVLTNAPLTPTGKPTEKDCGNCNICVDSCPANAFTGNNFNINEKRENRYDAFKCNDYLTQREQTVGLRVCGICIQVCPYGKKLRHTTSRYS